MDGEGQASRYDVGQEARQAAGRERGFGVQLCGIGCTDEYLGVDVPGEHRPHEHRCGVRPSAGGGHDGVAAGLLVQRPQTERPGVLASIDESAGREGVDGGLGIFATDGHG